MLLIFLVAATAGSPTDPMTKCQPAIERKIGGQPHDLSADQISQKDGWTIVIGRFTSAQGTPPAPPGYVRPYHLIRLDYRFTCWIKDKRVRALKVEKF
jgi:hypothetical protein